MKKIKSVFVLGGTLILLGSSTIPSLVSIASSPISVNADTTSEIKIVKSKSVDASTSDLINQAVKLLGTNTQIDQIIAGISGDAETEATAKTLDAKDAGALKADGFLVKSGTIDGKKTILLEGKDVTGLFYAVHQLVNLIQKKTDLTKVDVYDSPKMPIRGVIEGFYGAPWSDQARKDLFKFMGEHRLNTYIYTPKDDTYLRKNWRELYPADKLAELKALVQAANDNHVNFAFALSPGNDITYSKQADYDATVAKFDQLKSIGVKQFYIALDDIPLILSDADKAVFKEHSTPNYPTNKWSALADAQASYLNKIQKDYVKANNLPDLWLVPTNYNGSAQDPFKEAQGLTLDKDIRMQWTGEGVFSANITTDSINKAKTSYHTDHMFIWDNFPVNDSNQDRLFLNPVEGRQNNLDTATDGITANPMIQPYASWIAIAGFGDYLWNPVTYNAAVSQKNVLAEIGGTDQKAADALNAFVDLNQYWDYAAPENKRHAPELSALINNYIKAIDNKDRGLKEQAKLIERLDLIENGETLMKNIAVKGFYNDSLPWIQAAAHWAKAAKAAVFMIGFSVYGNVTQENVNETIQTIKDERQLAQAKLLPDSRTGKPDLTITPTVGDGVFDSLIESAYEHFYRGFEFKTLPDDAKLITGSTPSVASGMGVYGDNAVSLMADGKLDTKYWSNDSTKKGQYVELTLKEETDVQRIVLRQGPNDQVTSGDVFGAAHVEVSTDNKTWTNVGAVTSNGHFQLDLNQPVKAKYVRIIADQDTNNWLQVREFTVYSNSGLKTTNILNTGSYSLQAVFDNNMKTEFTGKLSDPTKSGIIEQTFKTPFNGIGEAVLIGKAQGTVYVHTKGVWKKLGVVDGKNYVNHFKTNDTSIDGLRLVVNPGTTIDIHDFSLTSAGRLNYDFTLSDVATIRYVKGYSINVWSDAYGQKFSGKRLADGTSWKVRGGVVIDGTRKLYSVGKDQWIDAKYAVLSHETKKVSFSGKGIVKYRPHFGINVWADPAGKTFTGRRLMNGTKWKVSGKAYTGKKIYYQVGKISGLIVNTSR